MEDKFRFFGCPDVFTLIVGEEREELKVARTILEQIPFFSNALKGNRYKEAKDKKFEMPEDDPEAVAGMLYFVVAGYVETIEGCALAEDEDQNLRKYVKAFVVADKFMAEDTANCIVDQIVQYVKHNTTDAGSINILSHADLQDSKLYEFLVEELAVRHRGVMRRGGLPNGATPESMEEFFAETTKNDLIAILKSLLGQESYSRARSSLLSRNLCSLHTHQFTEKCAPE